MGWVYVDVSGPTAPAQAVYRYILRDWSVMACHTCDDVTSKEPFGSAYNIYVACKAEF